MTSECSKGGLDLYSPTQIVIKMKMIVLNEVKESSVAGNSRMYKLNVESSRGVSFGCFNLSYQRGNIQSLCASVQSLCVGSKANGKVMGLDLILDCSLWITGLTHSGKAEHILLHGFVTAFSPGMSFVVCPPNLKIQRSVGLYFITFEI